MIDIKINHISAIPKYRQLICGIEQLILRGNLKVGDKMPSINRVAEKYMLSRDTVEKAYDHLKKSQTISGVKGKGYYVASRNTEVELRICLIFNKLSQYKKIIYYNIVDELAGKAVVDLYVHHCNPEILETLLQKTRDMYSFYVVMPHFEKMNAYIIDLLNSIPEGQLIILDKHINSLKQKSYGAIYQDFENDIFHVLQKNIDRATKYNHIYLVFPEDREYPYPQEIIRGFIRFGRINRLNFGILSAVDSSTEIHGNLFIVIEDMDLVNLVKNCKIRNLRLGEDVGLISYNDTPLKEILENGVTVISTDFAGMGKKVAEMILQNQFVVAQNPFLLLDRNSF